MDKLKQSLVEGLSKESKLRIDNLGISAKALNEELEQTPNFVQAVANIAKTEIVRAGAILDEAASTSQRWNATLENSKLAFGNLINKSGAVTWFQQLGTSILEVITPSEDLAEAVREEQLELNILAQKVTDVNITQEQRARNINTLNNKYPGFLKNLDAEKVTNEEIRDRLKEVNKGYIAKIALAELSQEVEDKSLEAGKQLKISFKKEAQAREELNKALGVTETNRLLETKSLKEAVAQALIENDVTEENIKAHRKGINVLNDKQKALLIVSGRLETSNEFDKKSNKTRAEASALQQNLNDFTAKYAEILGEVEDLSGTDNPEPPGTSPEDIAAAEKAKDAARKKGLADLKKYEADKLKLQNELALKAIDDDFDRKKLKTEQDFDAREKEVQALLISAEQKKELLDLLALEETAQLQKIAEEKTEKELLNAQAFEDQKRELENRIALENAETDLEKELLKAEQDIEKQIIELERLELEEAEKTALLALIEEERQAQIESIKEKHRQADLKKLETFNKRLIEADRKLHEAQSNGLLASTELLRQALGEQTALGKLLFLFQKRRRHCKRYKIDSSSQRRSKLK